FYKRRFAAVSPQSGVVPAPRASHPHAPLPPGRMANENVTVA
ncbi:MAG: hypothetical protein JWM88_1559, partial [Verrucomicrobia bacterium]|nr:hypothetical protein [Verrucomicrobiota bacterium]